MLVCLLAALLSAAPARANPAPDRPAAPVSASAPGTDAALKEAPRKEAIDPPPGPPVQGPRPGEGLAASRMGSRISLFVIDRTVADVLADCARMAGLKIRLNERMDDVRVSNRRIRGTLREVLDSLSREFNLSWFAENDLLEISKADSATIKTFALGRITDVQIRDAMRKFSLVNADFVLETDERNGVARVFAPPRLQSRMESIILSLRPPVFEDERMDVIRFGVVERTIFRNDGDRPASPPPVAPGPADPKGPLGFLLGSPGQGQTPAPAQPPR